jgi:UDP-N-acetylglucosamine diphosphorylase / glucose-1-phosphate thymidylyltransferase / UDP-N-acetylgalactosamine diphosphorylase / glucosamine-1-phosphate N-acetyltransferase / galactosamine-1-phosphate N-acetyltransferase
MSELIGLIPAAGQGVRARPYTTLVPKGMLQVNGRPNLERLIELMRDQLGILEIVMTVGYRSEVIKAHFGDGSGFGVRLRYVDNHALDKGLAWSILLAGRTLDRPCCVMLSDECYIGSNHRDLLAFPYASALATCTMMEVEDTRLIRRNYAVEHQGSRVSRLIEKPQQPANNQLGLGTFILNPPLFPLLEQAFTEAADGYVEFVSFLDGLSRCEPGVRCFQLAGTYVNINDRDSLSLARYLERKRTFGSRSIALVLIAEGKEQGLGYALRQYSRNLSLGRIYVALPAESGLEQEVLENGAVPLVCPREVGLYGDKIRYGLDQVSEDIVVMAEGEYSFAEHDINKLLEYLKESDMVLGTRTTRQLIEQGSDMRGLVRLAHVGLAKLLELLWWHREVRLSDVGCTFRAFWRDCYTEIRPRMDGQGPEVLAEMAIELLNTQRRIIEVPVNYHNRNQASRGRYRNRKTLLRILGLIARKRLKAAN